MLWLVWKLLLAPYYILVEYENTARVEQKRLREELYEKTELLQNKTKTEELISRIAPLANEGSTIVNSVLKDRVVATMAGGPEEWEVPSFSGALTNSPLLLQSEHCGY